MFETVNAPRTTLRVKMTTGPSTSIQFFISGPPSVGSAYLSQLAELCLLSNAESYAKDVPSCACDEFDSV